MRTNPTIQRMKYWTCCHWRSSSENISSGEAAQSAAAAAPVTPRPLRQPVGGG